MGILFRVSDVGEELARAGLDDVDTKTIEAAIDTGELVVRNEDGTRMVTGESLRVFADRLSAEELARSRAAYSRRAEKERHAAEATDRYKERDRLFLIERQRLVEERERQLDREAMQRVEQLLAASEQKRETRRGRMRQRGRR